MSGVKEWRATNDSLLGAMLVSRIELYSKQAPSAVAAAVVLYKVASGLIYDNSPGWSAPART